MVGQVFADRILHSSNRASPIPLVLLEFQPARIVIDSGNPPQWTQPEPLDLKSKVVQLAATLSRDIQGAGLLIRARTLLGLSMDTVSVACARSRV